MSVGWVAVLILIAFPHLDFQVDDDLSSSIKNGYLLLEDRVDGSWTKHYFVLTDSKITYAETHDEVCLYPPRLGEGKERRKYA